MRMSLAAHAGLCLALALAGAARAQVPVLPEEPYPDQAPGGARGSEGEGGVGPVRGRTQGHAQGRGGLHALSRRSAGRPATRAQALRLVQRAHERDHRRAGAQGLLRHRQNGMRIPEVVGLERKVSPKSWKAFDDQMARYSN